MKLWVIFSVIFLNSVACVNAVTYINHGMECKIDFPCQYESDTSTMDFPGVKVSTIRLTADEEINGVLLKYHIAYRFICNQFYPSIKNVPPAELMKAMRMYSKKMNEDSFIAMDDTVLYEKQSTFKRLPSIDYKLENKNGLMECRKIVFWKDKIYALSFLCLKSLFDVSKMNVFFESFEVTPDK